MQNLTEIYLIRRNVQQNASWYGDFYQTEEKAIAKMLDANQGILWLDEQTESHSAYYRVTNPDSPAWVYGDTVLDLGDYSESVHHFVTPDPLGVLRYIYANRKASAADVEEYTDFQAFAERTRSTIAHLTDAARTAKRSNKLSLVRTYAAAIEALADRLNLRAAEHEADWDELSVENTLEDLLELELA